MNTVLWLNAVTFSSPWPTFLHIRTDSGMAGSGKFGRCVCWGFPSKSASSLIRRRLVHSRRDQSRWATSDLLAQDGTDPPAKPQSSTGAVTHRQAGPDFESKFFRFSRMDGAPILSIEASAGSSPAAHIRAASSLLYRLKPLYPSAPVGLSHVNVALGIDG
jgi:hypothetical protein